MRAWALRTTSLLALGASLLLAAEMRPAMAASDGSDIEELVVTASRVQRTGFTAPTPTTVLTAEELQRTGATNIGQFAAEIPAFLGTATPASTVLDSGGMGGNYLDLRGFGPTRTLILVDGRRHVPTSARSVVDTNVIPAALVERMEVVTGGASAAWGSDAVAGVVNIILKKNLEGLQGEVQGGISQRGDNKEYKVALAYGTSFAGGRGHISIAGETVDNRGILHQSDRPWSAKDWGVVSTSQFNRVIVPNVHLAGAAQGGVIVDGPLAGTQFGPGGVPQPFQYGTNIGLNMQGGDGVNFGRTAALLVPLQRSNIYTRASYDLTDNVTVFAEGSYARGIGFNRFLVQPFDIFPMNPLTISTENAFLPASVRNQLQALGQTSFTMGRLNTDFGFIRSRDDLRTYRGVLGAEGRFGDSWRWNAYYEYGSTRVQNTLDGNRIEANYAQAVDSVIDPATGAPTCRSTLTNPGNGCVPINLFGPGSPSQAAIRYVTGRQYQRQLFTEHVAAASIQGEPFSTWAGKVSLAAGVEYRREEVDGRVDALSSADAFLIGNPKGVAGSYDVKEGFIETVVPLLSDLSFVKSLDFNGAARFTDYSSSGYVTTWKAGLSYAVNDELRLRFTRSRDIRAPNIAELFATPSMAFTDVIDPVTGQDSFIRNPSPANPGLQPEKADTMTFGFVYQPAWVPGLRTSVDFYNIDLKGAISSLSPQDTVNRCAAGNSSLCRFVQRDARGVLTAVTTPLLNISELKTRGIDFEVGYAMPMSRFVSGWQGDLSLRLLANYVDRMSINDGVNTVDQAGAVAGVLFGVPHWRANASATYRNGPLTLFLEGRFIEGGTFDNTFGPRDIQVNHVPARFYVNMSAQYSLYGDRVQLFGVINNLFDRDPPIIAGSFVVPQATNPVLYDVIGRTFTAGVRFKF